MKLYWNQMSQVFCVHHVIWVPGGRPLYVPVDMCSDWEPLKWRKKLRDSQPLPWERTTPFSLWQHDITLLTVITAVPTQILLRSLTLVLSTWIKGFLSVGLIHPISLSVSYKSHQTRQEHVRLIFHSRKRSTLFCRKPIFGLKL